MIKQLRYEGARLDDVLDRVRAEHGPEANIISADLSRTGGVAGFFARETFEVVVEVVEPDPATAAAAAAAGVSVTETAVLGTESGPSSTAGSTPAGSSADPTPATEPTGRGRVERRQRAARAAADPLNAAVEQIVSGSAGSPPPPPQFVETPAPGDFARMLADMIDDPRPGMPDDLADPSMVMIPEAGAPIRPIPQPGDGPTSHVMGGPADGSLPPTMPPTMGHLSGTADGPTSAPRHMSVPTDLAPVPLGELVTLLDRILTAPTALPDTGVIAIVGSRADAVEVAVMIAEQLGRSAAEVMIAAPTDSSVTPETIATVVSASRRRREMRGQCGPSIVAVAVMPGVDGHEWAAQTLRLLKPTQSRLAVAAWRPLDRLMSTMGVLPAMDVIDLIEMDGATEPEAFLRLGVPVATVDGMPSTATAWAALLLECGRAAEVVAANPPTSTADR